MSKALRLCMLFAIVGLAVVSGSASQADPLCPTEHCTSAMDRCIAEGNNSNYFPYRTTVGTCTTSLGDPETLRYVRCCQLPGCSQEIWISYCWE